MSQEIDENNPRVVAYPPVKFTIKKEVDDPEELEASYFFFKCEYFVGNLKDTLVFLANNQITTLMSGAFLAMLQQMDSSSGFLDVSFSE